MARLDRRLDDNAAGQFFVDDSCIDCDACRQIAPATFVRSAARGQSIVGAQPEAGEGKRRALMALVACPTSSIGTAPKADPRPGIAAFPERIGDRVDDNVYYCGFHSADSYGAASYLVVRSDGNVLVDSPRAARSLMDRVQALGGVRWLFLSHRDDVADHEVWARRFGCERIMHDADAGRLPIERRIDGKEPIALADDLLIVPVPGHTEGSLALIHKDRFLFSGDHLWWDEDEARLDMGRGVCWYSWREQLESLVALARHDFEWVLPGHGRRFNAASKEAMHKELARTIYTLGARRV
jgi:glyoxylase-like metal-dependent hydrolase (beta-lactamase superfamily II)/ferredoxin